MYKIALFLKFRKKRITVEGHNIKPNAFIFENKKENPLFFVIIIFFDMILFWLLVIRNYFSDCEIILSFLNLTNELRCWAYVIET